MVEASDQDVSLMPPCGRIQGMSNWEETQTPNTLEGLHIPPSLGKPQDPPGPLWKDISTTLLRLQPPQVGVRRWMDGIVTKCVCATMHLHFLPIYRYMQTTIVRILCAQREWALLSLFRPNPSP